jgi:NhaP-type Na+/H+ or K+/H+ antiporter
MKNRTLIIVLSFLAVLICLILIVLLFYTVPPSLLIVLALTIGMITGICTAFLILGLVRNIRNKRSEKG